jgi:hypothetical protein
MKIKYRKPNLIEQMSEAISTSEKPIESIVLTQAEFQTVFNYLDKSRHTDVTQPTTYSFKGIPIEVTHE